MIPDDIITEGKFNTYADILEITNSVYKKENISRKEEIVWDLEKENLCQIL